MRSHGYTDDEIAWLLELIGDSYRWDDQHSSAIDHYSQSITVLDTASARASRAWAYAGISHCANAVDDSQAALRLPAVHWDGYHSSAEAYIVLGDCELEAGDYEQSADYYVSAVALMHEFHYSDEDLAFALSTTGTAFYIARNYRNAIDYYSQAIDLDDNASTREDRAWAYLELPNCGRASADARAALQMPEISWVGYHSSANAHRILALCHVDNSEWELALDHANAALRLMREHGYDPDTIADWENAAQDLRGS